MKILVCIGGPTGAGKTRLAIELSVCLGAEIISFDSRQCYKELRIGVARPSESELLRVPHHFIGTKSIHTHYTVADFESQALATLDELFEKSDFAVAAGGTGMYLDALTFGLDEMPAISRVVDAEIEDKYRINGLAWLQHYVAKRDPVYYNEVDVANPMRLLRAAKVIAEKGVPFSSYRIRKVRKRPFNFLKFALMPPREALYERINARVEEMIVDGLVEEARAVYPFRGLKSLDTVGYRELFTFFDGKCTLEEAIALIKQNSRRYAKRQMTWFNNQPGWIVLPGQDDTSNISFIKDKIHDLENKA